MSLPTGTAKLTIVEDKFRTMISDCATYREFLSASQISAGGTTFDSTVITWDSTTVTFDEDIGSYSESTVHVHDWGPPADSEEFTAAEFAATFNGALIWPDEDDGFEYYRDSDVGHDIRGLMWMRLRRLIPADDLDDQEKAIRDFMNDAGETIEEMSVLAPQPGYVRVASWKQRGPYISPKDHDNPRPWLSVEYAMNWRP